MFFHVTGIPTTRNPFGSIDSDYDQIWKLKQCKSSLNQQPLGGGIDGGALAPHTFGQKMQERVLKIFWLVQ